MNVRIDESWKEVLQPEFDKPYFEQLTSFVRSEYARTVIYPPAGQIFNAFDHCPFDKVKVGIIGQDPYHEPGQAHGLCFSVQDGTPLPPSLKNIYKELESDRGVKRESGCLTDWAKQGVLLLNAVLTVRAHQAASHAGKGWEIFTDRVIELLNDREKPCVFILWGNNAKAKQSLITNPDHLILTGAHPSPLGAYKGFFGGRYFSRANRFLEAIGDEPIDWRL